MPRFASLSNDLRTTSSDVPKRRAISADFNSGETLASSEMNLAQSVRAVFIVLTTQRIARARIVAMARIRLPRAVDTRLREDMVAVLPRSA